MGLNGSFLIVVIICFRHFSFIRFQSVFLWICAIVRLLFPFFIPVSESAALSGRMTFPVQHSVSALVTQMPFLVKNLLTQTHFMKAQILGKR